MLFKNHPPRPTKIKTNPLKPFALGIAIIAGIALTPGIPPYFAGILTGIAATLAVIALYLG